MTEEKEIKIKCYQCKRKEVVGGFKYFPFCSKECKKAWGLENRAGIGKNEPKYKTISECQKRIKEWRGKFKTIVMPVVEESEPEEDLVLF